MRSVHVGCHRLGAQHEGADVALIENTSIFIFVRGEQDEENDFHVSSTIEEHLSNPLYGKPSLSIAYNLGALSHKSCF